ncbi:mechanosensitive ion channel family protein [Planktothrix mougeotii]|uniref:Mechanosensitive ion channel family protein n=1 Tax=Planktothrix mougeotii LEGE 06226 TaxID=1828728 RepID=A0ABR9UD40_9CYAN|nr:mechanosensitive ion channel family protein [Planktothrix mougeotii]MBE9144342.1 mechanosensitive ion channel family protein [Planktothrix mougeotii LEGE 06226]
MLKILSLQKRRFSQLIVALGISLFALISTWSIPLTFAQDALPSAINPVTSVIQVGNLISAPVIVDGYELFRIAMDIPIEVDKQAKNPSIIQRAKLIENEIHGILDNRLYGGGFAQGFNPDTLIITVKTDSQGNAQILASDQDQLQERVIFTVTPQDAEYNGYSVKIWSDKLTTIVKKALMRGYEQRQPAYLYKAGLWSLGFILVSSLLSFAVYLLQKRLSQKTQNLNDKKQELTLEQNRLNNNLTTSDNSDSISEITTQLQQWQRKYNTNQFRKLFLKLIQLLIWAFTIWKIARFFPQTRFLAHWMSRDPLSILIIVILVGIAIRISTLLIDYFLNSFQEEHQNFNVSHSASQRRELRFSTYSVVLKGVSKAIWIAVGFIVALDSLEIPVAPVVAGLGIIGLALSFGSQNLIRDVLNGIFILLEDHYAVGDYITVGETFGYVEYMNLRITQIRGKEGRLTTLPNGSISIVHNQTKDWSRIDFKIIIPYQTDIELALNIMEKVIGAMANEPDWTTSILTPVVYSGVSDLTHAGVELEMRIKTRPGTQWTIAREFRRRLKLAFEQQGIEFGRHEQAVFLPEVAQWLNQQSLNKG